MKKQYTLIHLNTKTKEPYQLDLEPMTRKEAETMRSKMMIPYEWHISKILKG